MKKWGCLAAVIGLLAFGGGAYLFVKRMPSFMGEGSLAQRWPLTTGARYTSDLLIVDPELPCRLVVEMDVKTASTQARSSGGKATLYGCYRFPFRCRVLDERSELIHTEQADLAWDAATGRILSKSLTPAGGTLSVKHRFERFEVPPPGRVRVKVELLADAQYNAQATAATVWFHWNVRGREGPGLDAVALLAFGPLFFCIGVVIFIVGLVIGREPKARRVIR